MLRIAGKFFCSFCRVRLKLVPYLRQSMLWRLGSLIGLTEYQCPHCFGQVVRPCLPLGFVLLPIRWLFIDLPGKLLRTNPSNDSKRLTPQSGQRAAIVHEPAGTDDSSVTSGSGC